MNSLSRTARDRLLLGVLLLLLVALAALAWWQMQTDAKPQKTLYDVAFAGDRPDALDSITLRLPGEPPVLLKPKGDNWEIAEPVVAKAKSMQVQQIVTLLSETVQAEYPAGDKALATFGLAGDAIAVGFNDKEFLLGMRNPTNQLRYVMHQQNIYMVNEVVYQLLKQGLAGLKEE